MDPLRDPYADPLAELERLTETVPLSSPVPLDPIDAVLSELERSIEQPPVPELDAFADPLGQMLDQIESSIDGTGIEEHQVKPDLLLDQVEMATKHQAFPPEDVSPGLDGALPADGGGRSMPVGRSESPPGIDISDERARHGRRNESGYSRRTHGARAGTRWQGNLAYCTLQRDWVDVEECRECPDFESEDIDDEERCRYAADDDG
jgi:hypothetical protein